MIPVFDLPPLELAEAFALPPLARPQTTVPGLPPRERDLRDFRAGDVDLKVKIALDGTGNGPLSLVGAFAGWNELLLGVDLGVFEEEDFSVGVGAELYWARPLLFELFSELLVNVLSPTANLDWVAEELGVMARGTVHYNGLETFSPYALVLVGPNRYRFAATLEDEDGAALTARFASGGLRIGLGGGFSTAWGDGWIAGGELRYLLTPRFTAAGEVAVRDADGVQVDTLETVRYQRGPKGFSWLFFAGRRF